MSFFYVFVFVHYIHKEADGVTLESVVSNVEC